VFGVVTMDEEAGNSDEESRTKQENGDRRFVAQVIGNTSLLAAVLIYMGWNYENSLLEHFQVSAFSLGIGSGEYVLKGMVPLFQSTIVYLAALAIVILTLASLSIKHAASIIPRVIRESPGRWILISGILLVVISVPLAWAGTASGGSGGFWILLCVLGTGSVITSWPGRHAGLGSFTYPLAIVVAVICTLWIAGQYASNLGSGAAASFARNLAGQTAVTVYSVQSLSLSGPRVDCEPLATAGQYRYRCDGLRLLYVESGVYYLLPVGWDGSPDPTYVLDDSDQIRIELSGS